MSHKIDKGGGNFDRAHHTFDSLRTWKFVSGVLDGRRLVFKTLEELMIPRRWPAEDPPRDCSCDLRHRPHLSPTLLARDICSGVCNLARAAESNVSLKTKKHL